MSNVGGRKSSTGSGHRETKGTGLQVPVTSVSVTSGRGEGQSFINLATWHSSPSFKLLVNTAEE